MLKSRGLLPPSLALILLSVPLAVPGYAAPDAPAAVTFAQGYEPVFTHAYGAREVQVLRSEIIDSVSESRKSAGSRCTLPLNVTLVRVAPTHPTIQQQLDAPSLDPLRTVYRDGGAALRGEVLDPAGQVLDTVKFEYFAAGMGPVSAARDPWGDARRAIEMFSSRLVAACIKQTASGHG
jgi:hypothetical protein